LSLEVATEPPTDLLISKLIPQLRMMRFE